MRVAGRSIPRDALWLALIVVAAGVAASIFALQLTEFVIMPDELGYVKQGIELSHGNIPSPSDFWFNSWALLRPLMLALPYRVFSTPTAFDVSHVVGAFVMASTAIPAYLLARRVVPGRAGPLLVAALTVAVPWIAMAGTMMTEVVAYPAFVWACLAMHHGLARPGLRGDLVVAAAIAIAFFARTQLVVLAGAYALAVVLDVLLQGGEPLRARIRRRLRAHAPILAAVVLLLAAVAISGSPERFLGGYAEPAEGALFPAGTGPATRELLVYVVVAIGVVPLAAAAAWALCVLMRRGGADEQGAFAVLLIAVAAVMTVLGGSFTVRFTAGINDRYLFYIVPLLFIGMAAALARPPRRFVPALAVTGALSVWLVAASEIAQRGPSLVSPSMPWHVWLAARADDVGMSLPALAATGAAIALVALAVAARAARPPLVVAVACGALLAWCVAETGYTFDKVAATQSGVSDVFKAQRDWIDRALPSGASAISVIASVGDPQATAATWWDTSFWNKSVDKVVTLGAADDLSQEFTMPVGVDGETGRVSALDRYPYVVRYGSDTRLGLRGSRTKAQFAGLVLLEAERPYRAEWRFYPPSRDESFLRAGETGEMRVYAVAGRESGTHPITIGLGAGGGSARVTIDGGAAPESIALKPGERRSIAVPAVYSRPGHADLAITVKTTSTPATTVTLTSVAQA